MQILLTTKDTREGAALPLRTICYRHLSAAPHKQPYQGRNPRSERKTISLIVTRKKKPESEANVYRGG